MRSVIFYPNSRPFKDWLLRIAKILENLVFLLLAVFFVFAVGYGVGYKNGISEIQLKNTKTHKKNR
jgi:Tfp pilus assembly protein PilO